MRHEVTCQCGCVIIYETDSRPPSTVKCWKCKTPIKYKDQLNDEEVENVATP